MRYSRLHVRLNIAYGKDHSVKFTGETEDSRNTFCSFFLVFELTGRSDTIHALRNVQTHVQLTVRRLRF